MAICSSRRVYSLSKLFRIILFAIAVFLLLMSIMRQCFLTEDKTDGDDLGDGYKIVAELPVMNRSRLAQVYNFKYHWWRTDARPVPPYSAIPLCASIAQSSDKTVPVFQEYPPLDLLEGLDFHLSPGGRYTPAHCTSRQNIAIIIPYRDRSQHLAILLLHLHPFLQKQRLAYTVFVVEQVANSTFNKGVIMNAGFMEISKRGRFDCFIFHDVDLLPEDERILYNCDSQGPKHLAYALDKWKYKLYYQGLVGGAVALTGQQFFRINGYCNQFFGWGGEDDDFYLRILNAKYPLIRYPLSIARYTMIKHRRDVGNSANPKRRDLLAKPATMARQQRDGLNNLVYTVVQILERPLFTEIDIDFSSDAVRHAQPRTVVFPYGDPGHS